MSLGLVQADVSLVDHLADGVLLVDHLFVELVNELVELGLLPFRSDFRVPDLFVGVADAHEAHQQLQAEQRC